MDIKNLPLELQSKIFYYYAEHPLATMIKRARDDTWTTYKNSMSSGDPEYDADLELKFEFAWQYTCYFLVGSCDFCKKSGRYLCSQVLINNGDNCCSACINKIFCCK